MHKHSGKDFLFGAMLGSTLGALSALILTTEKGHKIKRELIDKYHEFEDAVKSYAKHGEQKTKKAMHKIAKNIHKQIKTVSQTHRRRVSKTTKRK